MIKFSSVSKLYKKLPALDDVTFTIEEGEFVLLTGHSGSGKSTIVKLLIREITPSQGKIFVDGDDITRMWRWNIAKLRRKIGVVFQDFRLLDEKNVAENIAFALEVSGKKGREIKEIVSYVLEIVGLEDKAKSFPYELSGGQKQRVAIARAMANDPKILIADEPTGNLDADATWDIVEILQKVNNWGTTVIMATHGQDIIGKLNTRIISLENGQLLSDSKNEDIKSNETFAEKMLDKVTTEKSKPDLKENAVDKEDPKLLKETEKKSKKKKNEENIVDKLNKSKENEVSKLEDSEVEETEQPEQEELKDEASKKSKQEKEEIVEKKKPKLKIGLSSKKTQEKKDKQEKDDKQENKSVDKQKKETENETETKQKVETDSKDNTITDEIEPKPKSNSFKENNLNKGIRKLLKKNNYNDMQDLMNAGIDKIKMIDEISGDQIIKIEKAIQNFVE